ncbi:MupA/Atu3671 family FMN-dependent luciferase-like monooxygenase [Streptacidiphilus sp. P02-A3a]|uniref:MupA/Atu3671 family FMN-dependent luciferase-like monooxygenase n=1 Tax=Streptacidiphilus sp. P02-A3a TaxID=2704468 RepID=UPI0015FB0517|nr:MupA/Atu3671 family FMN-dependent luciferase-like monooxygenase [Streptacidiphilus sp. P02-A3a]QMU69787.1 LLM class flavin-dependent oxidoreductase [Streptacidiphilus sp. P02-A3a]
MEFSLFYFAADGDAPPPDRYRLLLEGARFADSHGFSALWIPERHFHRFGGLYPNPAVAAAAVATVTDRLAIRAGSVVAPLHHPLRIAEEWSMVDNLSGGRAGVSLAAGWNETDFVLRPGAFDDRQRHLAEAADTLRGLWRGESLTGSYADGRTAQYQVFPRPVQNEIPLWITSGGTTETFRLAGRLRASVLTHLVRQDLAALAEKTAAYRHALAATGTAWPGHVTLMLHSYLDQDPDTARQRLREPLERYLSHSLDLTQSAVRRGAHGTDLTRTPDRHIRFLLRQARDRYLTGAGLFGTAEQARPMVEQARAAGVDEIACLIDFGVPVDHVLEGLEQLDRLRRLCAEPADHPARPR